MTRSSLFLPASLVCASLAAGCGKQEAPPPAPPQAQAAPATSPASAVPATEAPPSPAATVPPPAALPPRRPSAGATATVSEVSAPPATSPATLAARPAPPSTPSPAAVPPAAAPAPPVSKLPTRPRPKGKIALPAKLGTVTFDHPKHAETLGIACTRCHHSSRPEKPLAAEQQSCRDCHTTPATPPLKTGLQAAFHDPRASSGTCIDCHREVLAKGKQAPAKCTECHKK